MATVKIGAAYEESPTQTAKETWYADENGELTTDSAKAAFHITNKGELIQPAMVRKYGFVEGKPPSKEGKEGAAEEKGGGPAEDKAVEPKGRNK
jgi:hypothetical protein